MSCCSRFMSDRAYALHWNAAFAMRPWSMFSRTESIFIICSAASLLTCEFLDTRRLLPLSAFCLAMS